MHDMVVALGVGHANNLLQIGFKTCLTLLKDSVEILLSRLLGEIIDYVKGLDDHLVAAGLDCESKNALHSVDL